MFFDNYQNLFINISFVCLFSAMLSYWIHLVFSNFHFLYRLGNITSKIAALILSILLGSRWVLHGYFPLSNLYESLIFLSCILLFLQIILEKNAQNKIIGAIILPVVLLINTFASFTLPLELQKASPLVPALQSNWLMMHVSLMMLSYGTLITGSLLSILFLILRNKKLTRKSVKLIPLKKSNLLQATEVYLTSTFTDHSSKKKLLNNLDSLSYRIISFGFPCLTIGIIAGAVWANEAWGSYWSWDPKETWALITWLIFASYLHARIIKGWTGEAPAALAALGFFVVWICYLGVNFLGQGLHSYGWVL